ncbi:MAG: sulfatase [Planctomycetales bacterium]|nr:sulfatase [Planctomycetales bacterium]
MRPVVSADVRLCNGLKRSVRSVPGRTLGSLLRGYSWKCCAALCIIVLGIVDVAAAKQHNILFILADDLAWSDLGCYGHPWHKTPSIDRLAAEGMRMTNGYAPAPICSASRASILTGKTTARLGFEFVTKDKPGYQKIDDTTLLKAPPFTLDLPLQERTIAEHLGGLGYQTAFFGKWHLNQHHGGYLGWSPTHGPANQGFQIAVQDFGAHPYSWKKSPPETIDQAGEYASDSMVDQVCEYLSQKHDQPFFAMAASFYVHTPVKTPCKWLLESYDQTIPRDIPNRDKRVTYAAFLQTLDHHVGRILSALDAGGNRDDTFVVFMSDNGGHPEYVANAPLRGSKWNLYEGGIRVPMIARWPGRIEQGSTSDVPAIGYDLLPTFVDVAGGQVEDVDGVSIVPVLGGETSASDRILLWHFPYYHPESGYKDAKETIGVDDFRVSKTKPQSALRKGKHKLIWMAEEDRVELYDLESDISESNDLSSVDRPTANKLYRELHLQLIHSRARMATKQEPKREN